MQPSSEWFVSQHQVKAGRPSQGRETVKRTFQSRYLAGRQLQCTGFPNFFDARGIQANCGMTSFHLTGDALWQRMERAVEKVQQRLERTAAALEKAGIAYAIIDGNAVRAWVAQADEAAVRTTRDVDILLRRADWPAAVGAMQEAGFVYRHAKSIDMFLDGPEAKARHVIFAGEKIRREDPLPAPDVTEAEEIQKHRTLKLEPLVRMKLTAFRRKDQMHLLDMIDVELIDATWCQRLPPELAARLQELLENPEG